MKVMVPELSLVALIGASGSGKSSFARKHFGPFEVVSSDFCRGLISNDENDQSVSNEAFDLLHEIARKRLDLGRLTVVDATNIRPEDRKHLIRLAKECHVLPVAIVFDIPEKLCHERNRDRPDRDFGPHVIRQQRTTMKRNLRGLSKEGFRYIYTFKSVEEIDAAAVDRQPLWNNRKSERGPFDIVGDIHGCFEELTELLTLLGYAVESNGPAESDQGIRVTPPAGRKAIFVGDLVDRGPKVPGVLRLVMGMVRAGTAMCVPGNHDVKLLRKLRGKNVQITHGLGETLQQLEAEPNAFREEVAQFIDDLVSHYVLDEGRLVVAHAGLKEKMQGRGSGGVREFCLYGETTGETDEFGLPIRYNWAAEYRGRATVVYGHTPVPKPEWLNNTINIDTGCVFGGRLTAVRYPERQLVSVPARATYAVPAKPFLSQQQAELTAQQQVDDVLDLEDVFGKRIIDTRLGRNITIREQNSAAALEVMSRFAINPRWLIYLPPTMSPCETSQRPEYLEHPDDALAYFRSHGVSTVVCQQKHMGSRAVIVICRDEESARERFGTVGEGAGVCYTRTGRPFFNDVQLQQALVDRVRKAIDRAGFWEELKTSWLCLDCELMPWSAKAQELLRRQYAAVGSSGQHALAAVLSALSMAAERQSEAKPLLEDYIGRSTMIDRYLTTYRHYCWPVMSLEDLRLAPFHIMAGEGATYVNQDHNWHMSMASRLAQADGSVVMATAHRTVDLTDEASVAQAVTWWEELTGSGGEGMVVKPLQFITRDRRDLIQPAVKCRGKDYLRIIYGPEYSRPEHLQRLKARALAHKRSLALREFALGVEALERLVRREPLRRVHECVFGILALESEPVDPRL